jgi:hypothetical protein
MQIALIVATWAVCLVGLALLLLPFERFRLGLAFRVRSDKRHRGMAIGMGIFIVRLALNVVAELLQKLAR